MILIINKKMCSICGGSLCAGTGVCGLVTSHTTESVKIIYSNPIDTFNLLFNYLAAIFLLTKNQIKNIFKLSKKWLYIVEIQNRRN